MAISREGQKITIMLGRFLEVKGYNKAAVARKAGMDPEELYAMLGNRKIMTADKYIDICKAVDTSTDEIVRTVRCGMDESPPSDLPTNRPA